MSDPLDLIVMFGSLDTFVLSDPLDPIVMFELMLFGLSDTANA